MNKKIKPGIIVKIFLIVFLLVASIDYVGTIVELKQFPDTDSLEIGITIFGYVFTDITVVLAILEIVKAKGKKQYSYILSLICMIIRFVYDIYTFIIDGNMLDGVFNMGVFLILDALIIIFLIIAMAKKSKISLLVLIGLLLIYSIGEILGYPLSMFTDWDEFFLIASLLAIMIGKYSLRSKNE